MTAPNHAIAGALIGLAVANPYIALPLAFLSHFALDTIPHYDPPGDSAERIGSKRFSKELWGHAVLCFVVVLALAIAQPHYWVLAAICAFLATSPDLFWIRRFLYVRRTGKDKEPTMWFLRFHANIQWKTGPQLWWVEAVWFVVFGGILLASI